MSGPATETTSAPLAPERLVALARGALEVQRYAADDQPLLQTAFANLSKGLDKPQRDEALSLLTPLSAAPAKGGSAGVAPVLGGGASDPTGVQELMRVRASLELRLAAEADKIKDREAALEREKREHAEARETLQLQRNKLKELEGDRARLLNEIGELERKLRLQINETESVQLQFDKLKASRQAGAEVATEQIEQINDLKGENERLRAELEQARQQRDERVLEAQEQVRTAEGDSASTAYQRLWAQMREEAPEVFIETHVATHETMERVCDAFVDCVRAFAVIELHVKNYLKDLRQTSEQNDKLNTFYLQVARMPGLLPHLTEYLSSGRSKGNFKNLLRFHQVWARAFTSGLYKLLVRLPSLVADELNPRNWKDLKTGWGSEDAAIGKHFREVILKSLPDRLGTQFRKEAGDLAYSDYNDLFKRR